MSPAPQTTPSWLVKKPLFRIFGRKPMFQTRIGRLDRRPLDCMLIIQNALSVFRYPHDSIPSATEISLFVPTITVTGTLANISSFIRSFTCWHKRGVEYKISMTWYFVIGVDYHNPKQIYNHQPTTLPRRMQSGRRRHTDTVAEKRRYINVSCVEWSGRQRASCPARAPNRPP